MKTLFIAFFIGLCCFLSACNLQMGGNQVEKDKKAVAVKPDSSVVEVIILADGSILAGESATVRDEGRGIPVGRAEIYKNLGTSYLEQGELDKAIVEFKKAIQISPRFVEAHYLLADVYSVKGEGLLSRTFLEKAMALEGSYIIDTRVIEETPTIITEFPKSIVIESTGPIQLPYPPEFFQGPIKRMDAPQR